MSIEKHILSEATPVQEGHTSASTGDVAADPLKISGGSPEPKGRGHKDLGQSLRKGLELMTRSATSVYQTTGELDPGKYGAYVVRAGSSLSLTLSKPPSIPEDQVSSKGNKRERFHFIDLVIYYATDCHLTWPANVIFGGAGYELSGDPATLNEIPGPASNPRPGTTADYYRLTYLERTGQWLAEAVILASYGLADPLTPPDDATQDPESPVDPGDPDGGQDPEHDYVDENGDPIVPENPSIRSGDLLALQPGEISASSDAGASWIRHSGVPAGAAVITSARNSGILCVDGGELYQSFNLRSWRKVGIAEEIETEIAVENGDFESGDLTGWTLISGDEPRVLDTDIPPQQEGSTHYLTRDWRFINPQPFELGASVHIPSAVAVADARVSVDVYVEPHAEGELKVAQKIVVPSTNPLPAFENGRLPNFATSPSGDALDLVLVSGSPNGLVANGVAGSSGTRVFELRYATNDTLYPDPILISFDDIDANERIDIPSHLLLDTIVPDGSSVSVVEHGESTRFSTSANNQGVAAIFNSGRVELYAQLDDSGIPFRGGELYPTSFSVDEMSVTDTEKGAWHTISVTSPVTPGENLDIVLAATGSPADVYFDNVRVFLDGVRAEGAISIASDGHRHFVGTSSSIHQLRNYELSRLGDAPFHPALLAGSGGKIIVANGSSVGLSLDWASTFQTFTASGQVDQLVASVMTIAVLSDGSVVEITQAGLSLKSSLVAGSRISYDKKRQQWFAVDPSGSVSMSDDLIGWSSPGSQPISAAATDRRILCPDFGRHIGYNEGSRDLYFADSPNDWKLSPSLTLPIKQVIEIR